MFAAGYFRRGHGTAPGLLCLQYHLFLASMGFVLLADDAYAFMVAWETMALISYFLVTTDHRLAEIRRAGFLYLLIAHVGAIAILLSFGVMQGGSWHFTFDAMRAAQLPPSVGRRRLPARAVRLRRQGRPGAAARLAAGGAPGRALAGVGADERRDAQDWRSTACCGSASTCWAQPPWWWGLVPLALGLFTALYGVIFAAAQTDMKRLLAYSSIENIGISSPGLGSRSCSRRRHGRPWRRSRWSPCSITALNHAFMKSLLFLGTGAVLHATGERNLGKLGGLIRHMPWVAWLTLIGALAIAGLPPLNGFVSEWLLLQAFLFAHEVPHTFVNMLLPLGAAIVALAAALAGYVMVKFYGVIFLGQPREAALADAHDAGMLERVGLVWLAARLHAPRPAAGAGHSACSARSTAACGSARCPTRAVPWWRLAPIAGPAGSYAPLIFFAARALGGAC